MLADCANSPVGDDVADDREADCGDHDCGEERESAGPVEPIPDPREHGNDSTEVRKRRDEHSERKIHGDQMRWVIFGERYSERNPSSFQVVRGSLVPIG